MQPQGQYPGNPQISMQPRGPYPDYNVNTNINMVQNVAPTPHMEPPKDYLAWSLFNFFFINGFCLGYVATVYSIRSRDRRQMNDPVGAAKHASTARALNIAATVLSIICYLIAIIVLGVVLTQMRNLYYPYYPNYYNVHG